MTTSALSKSIFHFLAASFVIIAVPLPVASSLHKEPPTSTGLPVTIAGVYP